MGRRRRRGRKALFAILLLCLAACQLCARASQAFAARSTKLRTSPMRAYVTELLARAGFFQELTPEQLARMANLLTLQIFEDGDEIIRKGETGDSMFILVEGETKAFVVDDEGQEMLVKHYVRPGEYFGELALLMNASRRATIKASAPESPTVVASLSRRDFEGSLGSFRELLLQNAAFRPASRALARVEAMERGSPLEQLLGLDGELLGVVCLYLLLGTSFYTWSGFEELDHTSLASGFYYAVQASLAVGFGKLTPSSPLGSYFTAFYVILGGALLAGYLSNAVEDLIENTEQQTDLDRQGSWEVLLRKLSPLLLWWGVGLAFGRIHEGWDWGTAVLFTISATSTIGIQGLQSNDDASLLFCAIYCLVGVPLFASVLGQLSFIIAERVIRQRQEKIRERALLALGTCDTETLSDVFSIYDAKQCGYLTDKEIPELLRFLAVSKGMHITDRDVEFFLSEFDADGSGRVTLEEFLEGFRLWKMAAASER
eukprot:TRINITY_DN26315_c0_g1_i1.p1 TRINITY_DN26315_c0_g1~~TRINITY_DN26315_c0_g1_i1.p1  ORF type:complete len:488 (+),score=94.42 TRINITY_DN26315_c0_g1_i1:2-1465(+)